SSDLVPVAAGEQCGEHRDAAHAPVESLAGPHAAPRVPRDQVLEVLGEGVLGRFGPVNVIVAEYLAAHPHPVVVAIGHGISRRTRRAGSCWIVLEWSWSWSCARRAWRWGSCGRRAWSAAVPVEDGVDEAARGAEVVAGVPGSAAFGEQLVRGGIDVCAHRGDVDLEAADEVGCLRCARGGQVQ